ncbi:MAG: ParB/RepB/Spo0J family partition protein [Bacteroidetes bacterium]|nr:ParB/RepB/Spo0J family partition protein [Bacteroidota bacterium]
MSSIKKSALGRGLSALLENSETDITQTKLENDGSRDHHVSGSVPLLKVEQIEANPFQPRTHFEEEALLELSESIRKHGIIQPVTVRKMGYDKYQLISGERRFRASQIAGLTEVPAYVRVANDQAMLEMALVENIQRENLDAIEVAISYKRLIDECNLTQEELSNKVSKQRSTITNFLRLLKLPIEIQLGVRERKISMAHARTLINVEDKETQIALFEAISEQDLSVRQVEEMVKSLNEKEPDEVIATSVPKAKKLIELSGEHKKIASELKSKFSKSAEFKRLPNGKGKIVIPFNSDEDLNKLLSMLGV